MFQFTTENLLNDLSRVSVVTQATDKSIPTNGKGLKVKSLNTFISSHVSPVWKATGTPAVKEIVDITIPAITVGTYRLSLFLKLSGSADPDYARFDRDYGKPIDVEINLAAGETVASLATKLQAWFNKNNSPVSMKGTTFADVAGKLRITANTEYVRFQKTSVLEKYDATQDLYVPFSTATVVVTAGDTGFGTAWNLLKNFRIPTQEATYFTAENLDERPIAGTLYNQYTFRYKAKRNISGVGALGEEITSVTTHVLYVLSTLSSAFEALLTSASLTLVTIPDAPTPVDDEQGIDPVPAV